MLLYINIIIYRSGNVKTWKYRKVEMWKCGELWSWVGEGYSA